MQKALLSDSSEDEGGSSSSHNEEYHVHKSEHTHPHNKDHMHHHHRDSSNERHLGLHSAENESSATSHHHQSGVFTRFRKNAHNFFHDVNRIKWWAKNKDPGEFESLDYDTVYHPGEVMDSNKGNKKHIWGYTGATLIRWVLTVTLGIFLGCAARALEELLNSGDFDHPKLAGAWAFFTGMNFVLCMLAACMVVFIEPAAAGSGIAEVKAYLNGTHIPDMFRFRTIVVKFVGIILAVSAGLTVGPEGPMVHTGAGIASGLTRGDKAFRNPPWSKHKHTEKFVENKFLSKFHNDRDRRDFISAGAAAGLAAAFGAPIGGVLFALEEAASFWSMRLTWRCFVCTIITTFTLAALKEPYFQSLSTAGLLSFGSGFIGGDQSKAVFGELAFWEIIPFALIGILGGVIGAIWNMLFLQVSRIRPKDSVTKLAEVACVSFFTSTVTFLLPYFFHSCETIDSDGYGFQFYCGEGSQNGMASIFFSVREKSILRMFTTQQHLSMVNLGVAGTIFYIFMLLSSGISVPAGLFMPTIMTGACFGRMFGHIVQIVTGKQVFPGAYSVIGATALLGGIQRSSISLCVIIIEGTSNIHFLLPIVITSILAKYVGNMFNHSLYDISIHLKKIPFLEPEPMHQLSEVTADDCMSSDPVVLYGIDTVGNIVQRLGIKKCSGYPIISQANGNFQRPEADDGAKFLRGIILKHHLRVVLQHAQMYDEPTKESMVEGNVPETTRTTWFWLKKQHRSRRKCTEETIDKSMMNKWIDLTAYMNPAPVTVYSNTPLIRAYVLFRSLGLRHLPVVDFQNNVVGLITRKDLIAECKKVDEKEHSSVRSGGSPTSSYPSNAASINC